MTAKQKMNLSDESLAALKRSRRSMYIEYIFFFNINTVKLLYAYLFGRW